MITITITAETMREAIDTLNVQLAQLTHTTTAAPHPNDAPPATEASVAPADLPVANDDVRVVSGETPTQEPEKTYTLDDIRHLLTGLRNAKGVDAVKAIITRNGVKTVSGLAEAVYPEVARQIEEALA